MSYAYRAGIWCDGCGVLFMLGRPTQDVAELQRCVAELAEVAAKGAGWVMDHGAAFCPQCQIQRAPKPLSIAEVSTNSLGSADVIETQVLPPISTGEDEAKSRKTAIVRELPPSIDVVLA